MIFNSQGENTNLSLILRLTKKSYTNFTYIIDQVFYEFFLPFYDFSQNVIYYANLFEEFFTQVFTHFQGL